MRYRTNERGHQVVAPRRPARSSDAAAPPAPDGALLPDDVLTLQRLAGNSATRAALSRGTLQRAPAVAEPAAAAARPSLRDAVGFDTMLESLAGMAGQAHPMTAALLMQMKGLVEAKFVQRDDEAAKRLSWSLEALLNQLRGDVRQLGRTAPSPVLLEREEIAFGELMNAINMVRQSVHSGRYSAGLEKHWLNALAALERGLLTKLAPSVGPAAVKLPGGALSRKLYIGTVVTPAAIVNYYLVLNIEWEGTGSGGPTGQVGGSMDEEGKASPSLSMSGKGAGGSSFTGEIGADEDGAPKPSVGASTEKDIGGGSVSGAAKVDPGEAKATVTVKNPAGWTNQVELSSEGSLTYTSKAPSGTGVELTGKVDKATLKVMAPEIAVGNTKFRADIEIEVQPNRQFYARSMTQQAEVIRMYNTMLVALTATALAPVAAVAVAELPAVLIVAEGATFLRFAVAR